MEIQLPKIHRFSESLAWSIYGTTCDDVRYWADLFDQSSPRISSYLDAAHHEATSSNHQTAGVHGLSSHGVFKSPSPWKIHWINGNHFEGARQIVIHNPLKVASLEKRKNQLQQLDLVISQEGIPAHLVEWGVVQSGTVCISPHDLDGIKAWIVEQIKTPPLAALILTGGKSERMGEDKAMLDYHGMPQWQYLLEQATSLQLPVFISCKIEQQSFWKSQGLSVIIDAYHDIGPLAGILSAMKAHPNYSWLVMACDMPNWNTEAMQQLISNRNVKAGATAFFNQERKWFEPLGAIWESDVEGPLHQWSWVSKCPRKFLNQIATHSLPLNGKNWVDNINDAIARDEWFKRRDE
jgi:molybdopterin-guanine dinucleotide biosynthesis protein A